MDGGQFDALTRWVATRQSRRVTLGVLLGTALLGQLFPTAARRKGKRKTRTHKRRRAQRARRDDQNAGKGRGKDKQEKRQQKKRKRQTGGGAPPGTCCSRGSCTPGRGKNLDRCCFQDQDLTARNFQGANLGRASFARATLTAADFNGANLDQTCFVDANLTAAKLGGANRGRAIFCRSELSSSIDNSGCDRGTPCCPTCDAAHPCGDSEVCCQGRCRPGDCCDNNEQSSCGAGQICCDHRCAGGDCCSVADCPVATCQQRACQDHLCRFTPVVGEPGPSCPTVCCEEAAGEPVCCAAGVTRCQTRGVCGCRSDRDCGSGAVCCGQQCQNGVCCQDQDCPQETCQERACRDHECEYSPVFGAPGPQCPALCCRDANGQPECCEAGTTQCTASGRCRCASDQDCAGGEICCGGRCRVNNWTHQTTFGGPGAGAGQFSFPGGVAVSRDGLTLWVADRENNRISVWRRSGSDWAPLTVFGGGAQLVSPNDVAVAADEQTVWVAETGNHRIAIWTSQPDGSWTRLTTFGSIGSGENQLQNPLGVAVSRDGTTVWVADQGNNRVSIWTGSGSTWTHQTNLGVGRGAGILQFDTPIGVAVAADGQRIWVTDSGNDRISIWIKQANGSWTNQTTFGSEGDGAEELRSPTRSAVAADGKTVWVADRDNSRISLWIDAPVGWFGLTRFGSFGHNPGQLGSPVGVAAAADEQTVWVADALNNVVSVWGLGCPAT